jgi:DNA polymerase-1
VQAVLNARQEGRHLANVSEAALQEIAQDEPLVPLIRRRRAAVKRIGTYGTTYEQQVNPTTGRIHARYRQIGAETGRMACTDPPMQTVPRAKDYRRAFGPPGR